MKHWDSRGAMRFDIVPRSRREPKLASLGGLAIAVLLVAGLAWALSPVGPVAAELLR